MPRFVLHPSRTFLLILALPLASLGCRAGAPGAVNAASGAPGLKVSERAETGPITAIAARGGVVYAGSSRGLRRWDVASDDYETVGALAGVTAVGVGADGEVWVATESGVGRFVRGKAQGEQPAPEMFESLGGLGNITSLAPGADKDGAWAGGGDGLFRWDGKGWSPVGEVRGVTSLDLDRDGRAAWVGTRALGLFVAEGDHARAMPLGDDPAGLEIVGTAVTAVGTRVVGARPAGAGDDVAGGRVVILQEGEPQAFRMQPDMRVVRVVDTGKDAVLVAGPAGAERAYSLALLRAGEDVPSGAVRLVSVKRGTPSARSRDRWVAVPLGEVPPPGVTVAAGSDGAVYYGTERRGVARGAKGRPAFFSGSELVGDAERFSVACAARDRCFVATDGPRAWVTDGDVYRATRLGEADDAVVLAVAADRAGTIYAVSAEPKYTGFVITRLAESVVVGAQQAAVGDTWRTHDRIPLVMPAGGSPGVSFAAISPSGALWLGLRAHSEGSDDVSIGAVEIDLAAHRAIQHRAPKEGEKARPEVLPLPDALTGVFFDDGATWFSSLSGVSRWQQGDLRTWGENDGLASELVHGVAKGPGDAIWAATSEGVARLDDKVWRAYGGGAEEAIVACRGLARDGQGDMWIATAKGLRRLTPADVTAGRFGDVVVDGDQHDVKLDRFGRIWTLSSSSIAVIDRGTR